MHVPITIKRIKRLKDPPWTNIHHSESDRLTLSDGIHICTQSLSREGSIKRRLSNLEMIRHDMALVFPFDSRSEYACGITKSGHIFILNMCSSKHLYLIQGLPEFVPTPVPKSKKNKKLCGCLTDSKVQHNFEVLQSDFHQSVKVLRVASDLASVLVVMNNTVFHWKRHHNAEESKESVHVPQGEWQTKLLDLYPHKIITMEAIQCSSQRFGSMCWKLVVIFSTLHYVYTKIYLILPNFQCRPNLVVERQIKISDILPKTVKIAIDSGADIMAIAQNCHKSQDSSVKILVPQSNQIFATELNGEDMSCISFGPGNQVIHCLGSSQRLFLLSRTGLLLMTTLPNSIPKPFIDLRHFKSDSSNSVPMFHTVCFGNSSAFYCNGTDLIELSLPQEIDNQLQFVKLLISRAQFIVHPKASVMVQRLRKDDLSDWKLQFCAHGWREDLDTVKISLNLLSHSILDTLIAMGSLEHSRRPLLKVQRLIFRAYGMTLLAEVKGSSSKGSFGRKWLRAVVSFGKLDQGQNSLSMLSKLTRNCFSIVSENWPKDEDFRELLRFLRSVVLDFRHTFENVPGMWIKRHIYKNNLATLYNQAQIRNEIPILIKIQRHFQTRGQVLMKVPNLSLRGQGCLAFYKGQPNIAIRLWHQGLTRNRGEKVEQALDIFYCLFHCGAIQEFVLYMNWIHEAHHDVFKTLLGHFLNLTKVFHGKSDLQSKDYLRSFPSESIQVFRNQALNHKFTAFFGLKTALNLMCLNQCDIKDFQNFLAPFNLWRENLVLVIIQSIKDGSQDEPGQVEENILNKVIDLRSSPSDNLLPDLLGLLRLFPNASIAIHSQICVLFSKDKETPNTNHVLDNNYAEIKWVEWLLLLLKELDLSHFEIMIHSPEFSRHCQRQLNRENETHLKEIILPKCLDPCVCRSEDRNDNIYKALDIYDHIDYVSTSSNIETISFLIAELPTTDQKAKYLVRFHGLFLESESVLVRKRVKRMMAEMRKVKVKIGDLEQSVENWLAKGPPIQFVNDGIGALKRFVIKTQLRLRTTDMKNPPLSPLKEKLVQSSVPRSKDFLNAKKGLFRSPQFQAQKEEFYSIKKHSVTEKQENRQQNLWTLPLWNKCQIVAQSKNMHHQIISQLYDWLKFLPNATRYKDEVPCELSDGEVLTLGFMEHILTSRELEKEKGEFDPKTKSLDNPPDKHDENEDSYSNSPCFNVCVSSQESGLANDTDKHFIVADVHREVPIPKPRKLIHSNDKEVFSSSNNSTSSDTSMSVLSTIFEVSEEEELSKCPELLSRSNVLQRDFGTQTNTLNKDQDERDAKLITISEVNLTELTTESDIIIDPGHEKNEQKVMHKEKVLDKEASVTSTDTKDNFDQDVLIPLSHEKNEQSSNFETENGTIHGDCHSAQDFANDNDICQEIALSNDKSSMDKDTSIFCLPLLKWDNANFETKPTKAVVQPVPKVKLLNKNVLDELSGDSFSAKEQRSDSKLKLPPLLYLDDFDDDDGNDTDNYFDGIVHFKSSHRPRQKMPKIEYEVGKFDHLLEGKLEKKAFDEFADIQYAIRCALDRESTVVKKAKAENPAPIIVHSRMEPMKAKNAEANFNSATENFQEKNTPIMPDKERISIGVGTNVERADAEIQVKFSKLEPEVILSRTYSVSLHTRNGNDHYSGNEASSAVVEDYSAEFDEDSHQSGEFEEEEQDVEDEFEPGTNDEGSTGNDDGDEYSNTSKDVPTLESDRISPDDSPKLAPSAPETLAPSSSPSSQDNSFKFALREVTNDSSESFLKRTNMLEHLNTGLNYELGRSSRLLRTLTEVSNINEGTERKQYSPTRKPATTRLPERQESYFVLQRQVLNNLKAERELEHDRSQTREAKFEQIQKELWVCLEQDCLANLELPFTHHIIRQSKQLQATPMNPIHIPVDNTYMSQASSSSSKSSFLSDNDERIIPDNHPVTTHYEPIRVVPRLEAIQEVVSEEYSRSSSRLAQP